MGMCARFLVMCERLTPVLHKSWTRVHLMKLCHEHHDRTKAITLTSSVPDMNWGSAVTAVQLSPPAPITARMHAEEPKKYVAFLREVSQRTGKLFAQWQAFGFVHGVLNTDNMSIVGETIDYGYGSFPLPCMSTAAALPAMHLDCQQDSLQPMARSPLNLQVTSAFWSGHSLEGLLVVLTGVDQDQLQPSPSSSCQAGTASHLLPHSTFPSTPQ